MALNENALSTKLSVLDEIEVDTLVVENVALDSLIGGHGLTEVGASSSCYACASSYSCSCSCSHALHDADEDSDFA